MAQASSFFGRARNATSVLMVMRQISLSRCNGKTIRQNPTSLRRIQRKTANPPAATTSPITPARRASVGKRTPLPKMRMWREGTSVSKPKVNAAPLTNAVRTAHRVAFRRIRSRTEKQRVTLLAVNAAPTAMNARPAIGCIQSLPAKVTSQPDCGLMNSVHASKSFAPKTTQNIPKMELALRVDCGASNCFSSEFMPSVLLGPKGVLINPFGKPKLKLCGGQIRNLTDRGKSADSGMSRGTRDNSLSFQTLGTTRRSPVPIVGELQISDLSGDPDERVRRSTFVKSTRRGRQPRPALDKRLYRLPQEISGYRNRCSQGELRYLEITFGQLL